MKLVIASNNAHKIEEIKSILSDYFDPIMSMGEAGFDDDIVEDGETFEDNAMIKAKYMMERLNCLYWLMTQDWKYLLWVMLPVCILPDMQVSMARTKRIMISS